MPATKTQLVGGAFQDAEGNPLSGGYLLMKLSQDEGITGVGVIAAGIEIRIQLDSYGSVVTSPAQYVWANDVMTPVNSYYRVTGYTLQGQPAWGPNNQQVLTGTSGNIFDVGTWIPNLITSWVPPLQPLTLRTGGVLNGNQTTLNLTAGSDISIVDNGNGTVTITNIAPPPSGLALQTNEVANGSQTLLDLHASTGISLVDNGAGRVTITNTLPASSFSTAGSSWFVPGIEYGGLSAGHGQISTYGGGGGSITPNAINVIQFLLSSSYTVRKIVQQLFTDLGGDNFTCAVYSLDGTTKLLDAGTNAFSQSTFVVQTVTLGSPVILGPGNFLFAWGSTAGLGTSCNAGIYVAPLSPALIIASGLKYGSAANSLVGGSMPSSLGAITSNANITDPPAFMFMV